MTRFPGSSITRRPSASTCSLRAFCTSSRRGAGPEGIAFSAAGAGAPPCMGPFGLGGAATLDGCAGMTCCGIALVPSGTFFLSRGCSVALRTEGSTGLPLGAGPGGSGCALDGIFCVGGYPLSGGTMTLLAGGVPGGDPLGGAGGTMAFAGGPVGWDDNALAHGWRAGRLSALARWRDHGFRRRARRGTLPFPRRGPFLVLLVLVLVLLVGLSLSEHTCAAALDRLGLHKAARAGRKSEDTKESCQRAGHCWSRIGLRWWRERGG